MGSSGSKSAAARPAEAAPSRDAAAAYSARDEVLSWVIDGIVLYGIFVTSKYLVKQLKPMFDDLRQSGGSRSRLHQRLTRSGRPVFHTNYFEDVIAGDIVDPHDIDVSFADIGGLEQQKRDIYDLVVLPLKAPEFFHSRGNLMTVPKGILLYGKPGTGKTMLAKAIAKESGAFFIDLKISTIMSKWFGESQKLVRAAFSLARKLAPCIIFIDEVDAFMGKRGGVSDPTLASMKTEFMALWDGFTQLSSSEQGFGVIVMGATNRPGDVDPAFLRRMPRAFEIGLPNREQREKILRLHLRTEPVERGFDFDQLAVDTVHYSGSDLKELCRAALMIPLREHIEHMRANPPPSPSQVVEGKATGGIVEQPPVVTMRPLCMADFDEARTMVQPTGAAAYAYAASSQGGQRSGGGPRSSDVPMDMDMFAALMAAGLQQMMAQSAQHNRTHHA
jgi:ATPase family AAA domain-containing protein 1